MAQYIVKRLILLVFVVIGVLVVTFGLARAIPGDPCTSMLGEKATAEKCEAFKQRFGLNDSTPVQFVRYVTNVARGDFGQSIRDSRDVTDIIAERLPLTIELTITASFISAIAGVLLGIVSSVRHNGPVDVTAMIFANIGVSMPIFWLGLLLAYLFAITLGGTSFQLPPSARISPGADLPNLLKLWHMEDATGASRFFTEFLSNSYLINAAMQGKWDVFWDVIKHLILPSVAVATVSVSIIARMTRGAMLDVFTQDYIRVARAKGLGERLVVMKHAFRNALVPIVTVIGLQFGGLLSGAVLTETTFSLAGMGTKLVESIEARDYPVVQGIVIVVSLLLVFVNLLVDLSYAYLNPRIRVQ